METVYSRSALYFPIRAYLLFFVFTLLLFVFGPVGWKVPNYVFVSLYLILCNAVLYVGYCVAVQKYKVIFNPNFNDKVGRLFKTCLIISALFIIPKFFVRWNVNSISLSGFFSQIQDGLTNPSIVYVDKIERSEGHVGQSLWVYIYFLISPWLTAFFPLAILCYKKYTKKVKILIIAIFFGEILSWIGIGTNKGLLDIILMTLFVVFYKKHVYILKNARKALIPVLVILLTFITFFLNTMISRYQLEGKLTLDMASEFMDFKYLGFYQAMPVALVLMLAMISQYLNQGYYALSLALISPPVWSYGFGNSFFTLKIWSKLTGHDLMKDTYIGELQKIYKIDPTVNWHSFYVWCASDITFPGVVILMFFIGYLLGLSWMDILYERSAYASAIFSLFILMIFYFFANNQVISFSFIPFMYFLIRWLFDRYTTGKATAITLT